MSRSSSTAPSSLASSPTGDATRARVGAAALPFAAFAGLRVLDAGLGLGEGRRLAPPSSPFSLPGDDSRSGDGGSGLSSFAGAVGTEVLADLTFVFAVEIDDAGVCAVVVRVRAARLDVSAVPVVVEGAFYIVNRS